MNSIRIRLLSCALLLLIAVSAEASRFFVVTGNKVPSKIILKQLLESPRSLKILGDDFKNGWSVGYFENGEPLVFRGVGSSFIDEYYDRAVKDVAEIGSSLVFGHLRGDFSKCAHGLENIYPFVRVKNGKTWVFGPNASIKKEELIHLIGKDYLKKNQPVTCTENPPETWIDTELYFIFLLKSIELSAWNVEEGLKDAIKKLRIVIDSPERYFNFFLSDGDSVWIYREGNTLFYGKDEKNKLTLIASSVPDVAEDEWEIFPEGVIGAIYPGKSLQFMLLTDQFPTPASSQ